MTFADGIAGVLAEPGRCIAQRDAQVAEIDRRLTK
jgi:hypothetical protein